MNSEIEKDLKVYAEKCAWLPSQIPSAEIAISTRELNKLSQEELSELGLVCGVQAIGTRTIVFPFSIPERAKITSKALEEKQVKHKLLGAIL